MRCTRRRVAHRDRAVARRLPREPVAARCARSGRAAAPGQVEAAAQLRALLDGSALLAARAARRVQDPLSFRVVAQVQGSLQAALAGVRDLVEWSSAAQRRVRSSLRPTA
jgi:histidine ammonia-lyase